MSAKSTDATSTMQKRRLRASFAAEERSGLRLVLYARLLILAVLLVWAIATARAEYIPLYIAAIIAFAVLGVLPLLLQRYKIGGLKWMVGFFTLDIVLLTYILMVPSSIFPSTLTPQFYLQFPNFLFLCLFVIGMAISYSPMIVLWTGSVAVIAWCIGMFWILSLPETLAFTFGELLDASRFTTEERLQIIASRQFVSLTHWYNRVLFLALVTLLLTAAVWRARNLVRREITSEAARANLSRYFSPNMVDRLSEADQSLEDVDTRSVAVLFVDIVGFTEIAERFGPNRVIAMLRSYHRRMARTVFHHGGTIDKFIGDAVMAVFGTPEVGDHDASDALRCAHAMIGEVERWNAKRQARGAERIRIGIGIHFGEVVVGNIGDEHRLEYAVLGDTVNVASRLERLTREFKTPIIVSGEFVARVRAEEDGAEALLRCLSEERSATVRGRKQPVSVWRLDTESP